jgi:hypothetical protein
MPDPARIAASVVAALLVAVGGGGWWALARRESPVSFAPGSTAPADLRAPEAEIPAVPAARPTTGPVPAPGSVEARIADLEAALRDEQAAEAAETVRISGEIGELRERIAALEAQAEARRDDAARVGERADRAGERCDPVDPDSRACRRQAQLTDRQGAAGDEIDGIDAQIADLRAQERVLLAARLDHLAKADTAAARLRNDPELQALYRQLAAGD